jgi:putative intracellular protease/amidase
LVRDVLLEHKVLVLFGWAVPILYYANVVTGRRVTTHEDLRQEVEAGGGYYTGKSMEQDGDIITGFDNRSIKDVADAVVRSLDWQSSHEESSEAVRG